MRRYLTALAVSAIALAGCGGGAATESTEAPIATTAAPTTAVAPTTTEAPTTSDAVTTSEAPTTTVDAASASIEALGQALKTSDPAGLALFAPGSPAFVYYEALVLMTETDPQTVSTTVANGTISFSGGPTLSDFVFDAQGLITDMSRNDVPMSRTVAASGAVFEGQDEGQGIVGTVHSFRMFDGNLQVVVTTVNNSQVEGELSFSDYVSEGREFSNVFSNSVRPTVTSTALNIFEGVPTSGGTLYGFIWADGIGVTEPSLAVPPLG
ncbi:MAG: hypothetical protein AB7Q27_21140 [Acidimicrobiia bacterium]